MYTINNSDESALLLLGLNLSAVFKDITPVKERTLSNLGITTIKDCLDQEEVFLDYVDGEELLEDIRNKNYLYTEITNDQEGFESVIFNISITDIDINTEIKVLSGHNNYMVNLCTVSKESAKGFTVTLLPRRSVGILIIGAGEIIIEPSQVLGMNTLSVQASQDNKMIPINVIKNDTGSKPASKGFFKNLTKFFQ